MLAGVLQGMRVGVRYKLLALTLAPSLLIIPPILGFTLYWNYQFGYEQLFRKVNSDIAVASEGFRMLQAQHLGKLEVLAQSYAFHTNLQAGATGALRNQLDALRTTSGFDFLHLVDARGQRLYDVSRTGAEYSPYSPQLEHAARSGEPSVGLEVFGSAELSRESPDLASKARIPLQPTPHAAPSGRDHEPRGLVLRTVYPIADLHGRVLALLDGGVLLNRNYVFVDGIRNLVYGPGSVPHDGWGAVTLLLEDVRISTNVPYRREEGERALGTRISAEVRERVLNRGEKLVDRAFVVNQWYVSAYEPLTDVNGQRIGMLHAGFTEGPFRAAFYQALAVLTLALLLSLAAGAWLAFRGARSIFQPIEAMSAVVRAEQSGERKRIGLIDSRDEIGELARQLDTMLDLLEQRRRLIAEAAEGLERKVGERTRELEQRNKELQSTVNLLRETRDRLSVADKFAALGELTAGVAHEINNPIAVMLGNLDVVLAELGEQAAPVRTEFDLIVEQIYRVRSILDKLLRYSRPSDYVGYLEQVDVNALIEDTLVLVRHEFERKHVRVRRELQASGTVLINRQELQQVLVNLLLNAAHALPSGGRLELFSEDRGKQEVALCVKDYGEGISKANLGRVFDPFFTTRQEKGTGLGLSVSYSLINRYGGSISVDSQQGAWTRFDIFLKRQPVVQDETGGRQSAGGERARRRHG